MDILNFNWAISILRTEDNLKIDLNNIYLSVNHGNSIYFQLLLCSFFVAVTTTLGNLATGVLCAATANGSYYHFRFTFPANLVGRRDSTPNAASLVMRFY